MAFILGNRVIVFSSMLTKGMRNQRLGDKGIIVEFEEEEFVRVAWEDSGSHGSPWVHVNLIDLLPPLTKEELLTHPDKEVRALATQL